jgi:hypothetical protein
MTNIKIPCNPETYKAAVLSLEFQHPELAKSLVKLRETVADTLYGYLFEPQFWIKLAVSLEYPDIAQVGVEVLDSHGSEVIKGMQAQAEYYLNNLPKECNSYPMVQEFYELVTDYINKHSNQFIPKGQRATTF